MSGSDLGFFTKAVEAGRDQAYFIELLKARASSPQIKALADALTSTQEEENRHVARLAALKGWNVSLAATAAQKKQAAALEKLSGSNFDKAAMDKLVAASIAAMEAYQAASHSSDKDIKGFAAQMVPLAEEKRHVMEKMTGAGTKAAAHLFRRGLPPETPSPISPSEAGPPAIRTPHPTTPRPAVVPGATPAPTVNPTKSSTSHAASPTPLPSAGTRSVATPPGQSASRPAPTLPAILPPKSAVKGSPTPLPAQQ
jgi:putative membrane protein